MKGERPMSEEQILQFKTILSQYSGKQPEEIGDDMKFREDLQMSSLDFMTLLGEIEDEFDVEFEGAENVKLETVGDAIEYLGGIL